MFPYVSLHREWNLPKSERRKVSTAARMKSARTAAFETLEDEEVRSIDESDEKK